MEILHDVHDSFWYSEALYPWIPNGRGEGHCQKPRVPEHLWTQSHNPGWLPHSQICPCFSPNPKVKSGEIIHQNLGILELSKIHIAEIIGIWGVPWASPEPSLPGSEIIPLPPSSCSINSKPWGWWLRVCQGWLMDGLAVLGGLSWPTWVAESSWIGPRSSLILLLFWISVLGKGSYHDYLFSDKTLLIQDLNLWGSWVWYHYFQ